MSAQRERIASLKRQLKYAILDGEPHEDIAFLQRLIAGEETVLSHQREAGNDRTVGDIETDAAEEE